MRTTVRSSDAPGAPQSRLTRPFPAVFVRHGDRTPAGTLPGNATGVTFDCSYRMATLPVNVPVGTEPTSVPAARAYPKLYLPGRNVLPGNCMRGQLTSIGAAQHQALGASLRARYVDKLGFLSPQYEASEVYVRATDVPRTQQSAQVRPPPPPPARPRSRGDAGAPEPAHGPVPAHCGVERRGPPRHSDPHDGR